MQSCWPIFHPLTAAGERALLAIQPSQVATSSNRGTLRSPHDILSQILTGGLLENQGPDHQVPGKRRVAHRASVGGVAPAQKDGRGRPAFDSRDVRRFGAGKTRALCCKVVMLAMQNPGLVGAVFEPTHILLRDVWMRSFDSYLEEYEIEHDFRVSPQPEYVLHLPHGSTTILCRATETWNRIRGQNLAFICADEIDTSPPDVAQKAGEMFLARLRGGAKPQLAVASTPKVIAECTTRLSKMAITKTATN